MLSLPHLQSVLVESPLSHSVSPGVISLDPTMSESPLSTTAFALSPAVRRKSDPKPPQKPVAAYALFFSDTQAAIKGQNPNATFAEVSKIVASMWDSLGEEQKQVRETTQDTVNTITLMVNINVYSKTRKKIIVLVGLVNLIGRLCLNRH